MANIDNIKIETGKGLFVIAGPCVIESQQMCLDIAAKLVQIQQSTGIPIAFKASFDKANRSNINSFRGPGIEEGLKILAEVKKQTALPLVTDIHETSQAAAAAEVVDCIQIPAFLCRQTTLLIAAAKTGKAVNVKKGQFMSPEEMGNVVEKIRSCGNENVMLTERGTFFGYNRLVNDMTAISKMQQFNCPVIFDATHSTQLPGGLGKSTAGAREMSPVLAAAAVAAGADGLFCEVHSDCEKSKSDSACIMPIDWLENLLKKCKKIYEAVRS